MASKKMKVENVDEEHAHSEMERPEDIQTIPQPNISRIKNKILRNEMYKKLKMEKRKAKLKEKQKKKKEEEAMGDDAPPKQVPKTIENMRVPDETMVDPEDTEVMLDEAQDELASYFNREIVPKILITTCDRPCLRTNKFCKELKLTLPNADIKYRRGLDLKKIIPQAMKHDYTDILVVNEDMKEPNGLIITHLPEGPTAHFKLSNLRLTTQIKRVGEMSQHRPELILNNFNTRLGHSVGRMIASLFPHDPQFQGRRVITFHNQRDFIFFRHHRYVFKNNKRVDLKELGPRFTLKLRSLQKGTFDSKFGEYEWIHKRKEMETSRRKFSL